MQITGEGNEQQILSSMQAYPDRASYMTEALRGLFHFSKNWTERKPEVLQVKMSADIDGTKKNDLCIFYSILM